MGADGHQLLLHPADVLRNSHDAMRVVSGEVSFDQRIGDNPRLVRSCAGRGENLVGDLLKRIRVKSGHQAISQVGTGETSGVDIKRRALGLGKTSAASRMSRAKMFSRIVISSGALSDFYACFCREACLWIFPCAMETARRIAAFMLVASARFFPAISKAVP